jgi:hypothetical protein
MTNLTTLLKLPTSVKSVEFSSEVTAKIIHYHLIFIKKKKKNPLKVHKPQQIIKKIASF